MRINERTGWWSRIRGGSPAWVFTNGDGIKRIMRSRGRCWGTSALFPSASSFAGQGRRRHPELTHFSQQPCNRRYSYPHSLGNRLKTIGLTVIVCGVWRSLTWSHRWYTLISAVKVCTPRDVPLWRRWWLLFSGADVCPPWAQLLMTRGMVWGENLHAVSRSKLKFLATVGDGREEGNWIHLILR